MDWQEHTFVFVGGLHRSGTTLLAPLPGRAPAMVSGFSGTGAREDEGQHLQTVYRPGRAHGGPGRFGFDPEAHLTETSPLVTDESRAPPARAVGHVLGHVPARCWSRSRRRT